MKRIVLCAAVLLAALSTGACASLPGATDTAAAPAVLGNLQHCKRTYQASIGGLGVPGGSLYIECPAKPFDGADETPVE